MVWMQYDWEVNTHEILASQDTESCRALEFKLSGN